MAKDRDDNGRFVKGHSGNPNGRASKSREERYYEITMSACSYKDWEVIVKKAVDQAKRGDIQARKWLSDYLVGVPEQPITGALRVIVNWDDTNTD